MERGRKTVLGYSCRYIEQPGIWNGTPYEVVQDRMRGSHIALVKRVVCRGPGHLDGLRFDHLSLISGHPIRVMKWVSESQEETPVQRAGQAC